jgi:hypothetical protein
MAEAENFSDHPRNYMGTEPTRNSYFYTKTAINFVFNIQG